MNTKINIFIFLYIIQFFYLTLESKDLRVLIGSPIHQKPAILSHFLDSLNRLHKRTLLVDYYFINDNVIEESSNLLKDFALHNNVIIEDSKKTSEVYKCDEVTHYWSVSLAWKVADFKNIIIKYARENNYDYVFLLDSDLVLNPRTLVHLINQELISTNRDLISNIFWTKFTPHENDLPQVWMFDEYNSSPQIRDEIVSRELAHERLSEFCNQLKQPGIYKVGGLGACTLFNRRALETGLEYTPLKNLMFNGEDRHFCMCASALDLGMYVDTHYPAYHIYRESLLAGVDHYISINE